MFFFFIFFLTFSLTPHLYAIYLLDGYQMIDLKGTRTSYKIKNDIEYIFDEDGFPFYCIYIYIYIYFQSIVKVANGSIIR